MFKQNINIVGIPILYNIFEEIRDNLSFKVSSFDNIESFSKFSSKNNLNNENYIIITTIKNKNFFIDIKKFNVKNIFFLCPKNHKLDIIYNTVEYPLEIHNLIEKINIQLIKLNYNFQSKIKVKSYILDLNSRIISNKDKSLKLTEREMDIILFISESEKPQKINDLQNKVWGYSSGLETHTVETHIYRLRKKINDNFNDDEFIISTDQGYIIE